MRVPRAFLHLASWAVGRQTPASVPVSFPRFSFDATRQQFHMSANVREEIESLSRELERHNRLYYVDARPEISDLEYDQLMKRLEALEAEHPELASPDSPTQKVGGAPVEGFTTVEHRVPMISIDNVYDEPALREFDGRVLKLLDAQPEYTIEYKIDGVALALVYEHGHLTQAVTRGDGRVGDDVTHNARTIGGVPLRLNSDNPPAVLEIRGEAYIANSDFAHIRAEQEREGEQPFANPRNATAGALKTLDPKVCAKRRLRFFAHGIGYTEGISHERHTDYLDDLHDFGVPTSPGTVAFPDIDTLLEHAQSMMESLHELDFEVDGLVIKVNTFAQRDTLGFTSKAPRWVIAYKWERYEGTTRVEGIDIQVGKTGALTPVAHLEPVEIAGTTVSRSSLHNRDEIERLGIRIGDWVVVEKAGKIIPHVVRVEEHRRDGSEAEFQFPSRCPECESEVVQDDGGVYIRCQNPSCPAQLRETLRFFASRSAMDVDGLGIKLIEQLIEAGLLASLADIYRLKDRRDDILALPRVGEKSVDNLLDAIETTKERPLWRLLVGLNIRHVGSRLAQVLATKFGIVDAIMEQPVEALAAVDEVGPIIAESVHAFFSSKVGRRTVQELRALGLNMGEPVPEEEAQAEQKLAGRTIVVTGTLERFKRDEIKELIQQHGGRASGSVSKKTSFVVAGADAGSKLTKAQDLGVEVISEDEFLARVS